MTTLSKHRASAAAVMLVLGAGAAVGAGGVLGWKYTMRTRWRRIRSRRSRRGRSTRRSQLLQNRGGALDCGDDHVMMMLMLTMMMLLIVLTMWRTQRWRARRRRSRRTRNTNSCQLHQNWVGENNSFIVSRRSGQG